MNDASLILSQADSSRRKFIAITVAVGCSVLMTFAFITSGPKSTVKQDTEQDPTVGVLQDGMAFQAGGSNMPDDWLMAPANGIAEQSSTKLSAPSDEAMESLVVAGDADVKQPTTAKPKVPASRPIIATAAAVKVSHTATPAVNSGNSASLPLKKIEPPMHAAVTPIKSTPGTKPIGKPILAAVPVAIAVHRVIAVEPAQRASPTSSPAESRSPTSSANPAPTNSQGIAQAVAAPLRVTPENIKAPKADEPAVLDPNLAMPSYMTGPNPPAAGNALAATGSKYRPSPPSGFNEPSPATAPFTAQGIWHDVAKLGTIKAPSPAGIVVDDAKYAFTPEGIPVRRDVPTGVSPLEKIVADKPLWKRTE